MEVSKARRAPPDDICLHCSDDGSVKACWLTSSFA
jgi:hypothetical protein